MTIYSSVPLRGYRPHLLHWHVASIGPQQTDCYHYVVTEEEGALLIAQGKAKLLIGPFACYDESGRLKR